MVTFLPVVALLLSLCIISGYFQTIPGSCLQTILGMEKRRLSKHRKSSRLSLGVARATMIEKGPLVDGLSTEAPDQADGPDRSMAGSATC